MWFKRKREMPQAEPMPADVEKQIESAKTQMQYLVLQSQINPHFLYNTLDSIRNEALKNQQPVIAEMLERLSKFFRYCISSRDNYVKLSEEINHIKDYFYIQKFRFEERFSFEIHIGEEDVLEYYVPRMILQPIVENSISHGLEGKLDQGVIRIDIRRTESKLYIIVSDNGAGIPKEKMEELNWVLQNSEATDQYLKSKSTGIALININNRIRLSFGTPYGLKLRSIAGEGTQNEFVLPLVDDLHLPQYGR